MNISPLMVSMGKYENATMLASDIGIPGPPEICTLNPPFLKTAKSGILAGHSLYFAPEIEKIENPKRGYRHQSELVAGIIRNVHQGRLY